MKQLLALQEPELRALAEANFERGRSEVYVRTDRMFAWVMGFQYLLAITISLCVSPLTWSGAAKSVHPHVWTAVLLGGLLAAYPIYLTIKSPGAVQTRHVIAVSQALFSALLIHLTGGRIETHFHIFGSLAFLAFYRDWRVLVSASAIVALDHVFRGVWFPSSIYGTGSDSTWRFLEHAGWVVFEDAFLIVAGIRGLRDLRGIATREAETEIIRRGLESARDEAERANRAKSEFLSRMSHELRTPMNSVLGFGQILQMDDLDEGQTESVDQIMKAGAHLLSLIDDVLNISRIESGEMTISKEPIHLSELIWEVLAMIEPLANEAQVILAEPDLPEEECFALADRQRLLQVLINLTSNAVKYNLPQGGVRISVERRKGRVRIVVADDGIGIPEERRSRLFTPFERLGAQNTDIEGTGLGLSLSKNLAEAMGGQLGLLPSEKGSRFFVELEEALSPMEALNQTPKPVRGSTAVHTSEGTILLIEDNPVNARLIERILEARPGYRLTVERTGQQGIEKAKEICPDLVVLDLDLPDIHGGEVLRRLREEPSLGGVTIFVVSADAISTQNDALIKEGANHCMSKPIEVGRFLALLDDVLAPEFRFAA